ncbi:MAG TPA: class I SAM-dependent methyltransferase [Patescibacteria group bacterium]|nr:class I SAM-dependent methyltransferase [Patescibacteria group bacterium]
MESKTYGEMYQLEQTYFWFVGKQAFIRNVLSTLPQKHREILDVGCGTGGTTKCLMEFGRVTALEKNPDAARFARSRGIKVVEGNANHLPFPSESFDLTTFIDVLYHIGISEPKALSEAFRILSPHGYLLITDCAGPALFGPHDITMDAKYRYTKNQLESMVTQAGFQIDVSRYIYTSVFPLFAFSRILAKIYPRPSTIPRFPKFLNSIFTGMLRLEGLFSPKIPAPFGSSILILAHKS